MTRIIRWAAITKVGKNGTVCFNEGTSCVSGEGVKRERGDIARELTEIKSRLNDYSCGWHKRINQRFDALIKELEGKSKDGG